MSKFVDYQLRDGIATLTMDDGKANAWGVGMTSAITESLDRTGYAQVKQRLRTARERLIRGGLTAEMDAR